MKHQERVKSGGAGGGGDADCGENENRISNHLT